MSAREYQPTKGLHPPHDLEALVQPFTSSILVKTFRFDSRLQYHPFVTPLQPQIISSFDIEVTRLTLGFHLFQYSRYSETSAFLLIMLNRLFLSFVSPNNTAPEIFPFRIITFL